MENLVFSKNGVLMNPIKEVLIDNEYFSLIFKYGINEKNMVGAEVSASMKYGSYLGQTSGVYDSSFIYESKGQAINSLIHRMKSYYKHEEKIMKMLNDFSLNSNQLSLF